MTFICLYRSTQVHDEVEQLPAEYGQAQLEQPDRCRALHHVQINHLYHRIKGCSVCSFHPLPLELHSPRAVHLRSNYRQFFRRRRNGIANEVNVVRINVDGSELVSRSFDRQRQSDQPGFDPPSFVSPLSSRHSQLAPTGHILEPAAH